MGRISTATLKFGDLTLENKIGEGNHREVYLEDGLVYKAPKPYVRRRYGPFHITIPSSVYSLYELGAIDLNKFEYANYLRIISQVPNELKDSFVQIFGVITSPEDNSSLALTELVTNFDGSVSKTLSEYGTVTNPEFWERFDTIEKLFVGRDIPYFDIREGNIAVKELEDGNMVPVLIDYKKATIRAYPFQVNLLLQSERAKKLRTSIFVRPVR